MAQRLNKNLVVGLTVGSMLVIAAACVLLIVNLPGRDPKPSVQEAEKLVAAAVKLRSDIQALDAQLLALDDEAAKDSLRKQRAEAQQEMYKRYDAASKYYSKAYTRALSASDPKAANEYMIKAGDMARLAGDLQMAMGCWQRVLRADPENEAAQQKVVVFYVEQAELYGRDLWIETKKQAERLKEIAPSNLVGLNALGRSLVEGPGSTIAQIQEGGEHLQAAFDGALEQLQASGEDRPEPPAPAGESEAPDAVEVAEGSSPVDDEVLAEPLPLAKFAENLAVFHLILTEKMIGEARQEGRSSEADQLERTRRPEAINEAVKVYDRLMQAIAALPENSPEVALAWRKRAQLHMRLRDFANAEFEQRSKTRSSPAELAQLKARRDAQAAEALACIDRALELAPRDVESLVVKGVYWRSMPLGATDPAERKAEEDSNFLQAKALFEAAIKADPESFDAYIELQSVHLRDAEAAFAAKDKAAMNAAALRATRVLEERIKRGITQLGLHQWRNKTYMSVIRSQLFQLTAWQVERVRALSGGTDAAQEETKPLMDQLRKVRLDYVADAREGEKEPRALFMKARLEMLAGKQADLFSAIKTFVELQDLIAPGSELWFQAKLYLAALYTQIGEPGPAVDAYQAVVKLAPTHAPAWAGLAEALAGLPDKQGEAEDAAKRALAISPDNRGALIALARVYEKQKNWRELERIQETLGVKQADSDAELLEASLLLAQANDGEQRDPRLLAEAQKKLRNVIEADPSNFKALQRLISSFGQDPSKREEVVQFLSNATRDIEGKLQQAQALTPPDAQTVKDLQSRRNAIVLLGVVADPDASPEERVAKTEALIRENTDPFMVALDLYRLLMETPNRKPEAVQNLKEAYRLKPDDPAVVEMLFRVAISTVKDADGNDVITPDWTTAEQLVKRAVELNLDRSEGHYYRGQLYLARTDLPDHLKLAENSFREALKQFPINSNGYAWLGRTLAAQGRLDEAQVACEQALAQNRLNGMAALLLAKLANQRGDSQAEATYIELCKQLNVSDPWLKTQVQLAQDAADPRAAIQRRETLRQQNPKDVENLLGLAQLYAQTEQIDKAKEVAAACYELQPKNLTFVQHYAHFFRSLEPPDYAAAEAVIRRTLESFGPDEQRQKATAQLLLAAHMETAARNRRPDAPTPEAIDAAFAEAARISDHPAVLVDIAAHYRRAGDAVKLEEWLRKTIARAQAVQDTGAEMSARRSIIDLLITLRDYPRADDIQREIEQYRAKFPDSFGLLALSDLATMLGRETNAIEYATQYINTTTGLEKALGLFRRGSMNYRRGDWDLAIKDLREAKSLTQDGFGFEHRILLARCLQVTGQTDQAIAELSSILDENRSVLRAAEELYRVYMAGKRYDEAEAFIMPAYQQDSKSPQWVGLLTEIAIARGDQPRAIQRGIETVTNANYAPAVLDKLLSTYLRFKNYDGLVDYVQTRLPEALRNDPRVLARLATSYLARGDSMARGKAMEAYEKMLSQAGESGSGLLSLIMEMPKLTTPEAAIELVREAAAKHRENALAAMADAYMIQAAGDQDAFIKRATELAEALPKDSPAGMSLRMDALQTLATSYYARKEFDSARKIYEQLLEIAPEGSPIRAIALNNLAYLLVENMGQPTAALPYAKEAARLLPTQTNVLDTLGWNLILVGEHTHGIATIRTAIYAASAQDLPQWAAVHYHAAFGLHQRSLQARQRSQNSQADQDLTEARLDCRRAHELLFMARSDPDGLLPKIVALGKELGITLEGEMPAANAPQP